MRKFVRPILSIGFIGFVSWVGASPRFEAAQHLGRLTSIAHGHEGRWTELNIGPFYIDTDRDVAAARDALTQFEQVRWVLGGLLESKDLPSLWPFRVLLTTSEKTHEAPDSLHFVLQNGMYLLACPPGTRLPFGEVAGILLDANTPRLPADVESGLRQLFGTLEAKGSRVSWGGPPAHSDLAWARMQLFATKFEYSSSFHIFLTALKGGSTVTAAERNAFGKDSDTLEHEAAANLASKNWQTVAVSGRPLDPKRDFGEHSIDDVVAEVYMADIGAAADPKQSEAAYKAAVEAGGVARSLGCERLAALAERDHENPKPLLDEAIRAGSRSAPVYVRAADGLDANQAMPLLKRAADLNPLWAEPVYQQAQLASDPSEKESLLKKAAHLDPRETNYWIELAQLQTTQGEATAAQGSWLRAEDSAANDAERTRVHQMRVGSEQERLDAAENARKRERDAAHLEDQRAQQAEADRIRAAEEKANTEQDAAAGEQKPTNVLSWDQLVPKKKLSGTLLNVDCLGSNGRLSVRDSTGGTIQFLLKNLSQAGLSCGGQQPHRRISLTYAAEPDDRFHTSGNILSIQLDERP